MALRSIWPRFALLAVPGTIVSAVLIAVTLPTVGALPIGAALILGAIITATDPVAVIAGVSACCRPGSRQDARRSRVALE